MFSSRSSPESTPMASISSLEIIDTGRAPVIFAPLICDPTTTTSSTSLSFVESSCANATKDSGRTNRPKAYLI